MNKLCSVLFICENKLKIGLKKVMHSFEVHSNESACRKSGYLWLEQVFSRLPPPASAGPFEWYN